MTFKISKHIRHLMTVDLARMQSDSQENRLLQLCAEWHSIRHHSEAPVSPEQCTAYRSTSASMVRRQLAASDAALAACWTAHQLQAGRTDIQDSADVIPAVSESAHLVVHQHTQHLIVVRACHFDGHHLPDDHSALPHLWLGTHCHLLC